MNTASSSRVGLLSLPPEILDTIAIYSATPSPHSATPSASASPASFLYDISIRPSQLTTPPTTLHSLQLVCKRLHTLLNIHTNPRLYARVFHTKFDTSSLPRRFPPTSLTSLNLAHELRRRCTLLKRMRRCVVSAVLRPEEMRPLVEELGGAGLAEILWLAYLMMVENDGLNYEQLCWGQVYGFLGLHHAEEMLEGAVVGGYPKEEVHKALALHLVYLLTDPDILATEGAGEAGERLFVLRPFVFAAHRFDAFMAPWTIRTLPIGNHTTANANANANGLAQGEQSRAGSGATNPFVADLTPRDRSCTITHLGAPLRISPPILAQGACFSFFMKVEKDPAVLMMPSLTDPDSPPSPTPPSSSSSSSTTTTSTTLLTRSPLSLTSLDHDKDMARLLSCVDPTHSPGLPPLFFRGMFEGIWEGRFSFFDFDSYREMLAGRMRSLYEGPFGEQPQIWKIRERIVRLAPGEVEGGRGSILAAGYSASEGSVDAGGGGAGLEGKVKGKAKELPCDWDRYPSFADEDGKARYEILLSGTGHSAWGRFVVRGRVRSWDGMLIMTKEYRPDGRGKWLYRGYCVAGNKLVGRWRDTFTPDNMYGYEGCFLFQRRGT